jgi:hypothetical protein
MTFCGTMRAIGRRGSRGGVRRRRMDVRTRSSLKRFAVGFGTGIAIACVDNFAFGGEVSPIVIVALLIAATATFGGIWGRGGWTTALAAWICVPLAHLVKHVLGLPDTLHPNTYTSILLLAVFTFVVATLGTGAGTLVHRRGRNSGPA